MSITLAVGTQVQIASAYAAAKTMSALSNAAAAVATLEASHGVIVGDYVEITSGWDRANGRIARASAVATNDVTLEGIVTTSTTRFPAGTGTGSVREISTWQTILQITSDIQVNGGEQNYAKTTTLANNIEQKIPTTRNAVDVVLPLFFDASLAFMSVVRGYAEAATPAAVRFLYPNGNILVANAYWSLLEVPTIEDSTLRGRIDLSFTNLPTLYAS